MGSSRRLALPKSWASLPLDRRWAMAVGAAPWSPREAEAARDFADHMLSVKGLPTRMLLGLVGALATMLVIGALSDIDVGALVIPFAGIYVLGAVTVVAPLTWRLRGRARAYLEAPASPPE